MKNGIVTFGILGAGKIAEKFAEACVHPMCKNICKVTAVASQTAGKSHTFANKFGISKAYDSYASLLEDKDIDCVYVANTPNFHYDTVMASIKAGKAVLCEKPFVTTEAEARSLFDAAKKANVLVMEAMWSRYLPTVMLAKKYIEDGRIGTPIHVDSSFCIYRPFSPTARLFHPDLQGGAINDLGVYNVSVTSYILGEYPDSLKAYASFAPTGVDTHTTVAFHYPSGTTANVACSICFEAEQAHTIYGTKGTIRLDGKFNGYENVTLNENVNGKTVTTHKGSDTTNGFEYEVAEFVSLYNKGALESPLQSAYDSITVCALLEKIAKSSRE